MKYIRTKSGVYDYHDVIYCYNGVVIINRGINKGVVETIVRQAETIDELLDGDILFANGELKKIHSKAEGFSVKEYGKIADRTVLGFIETYIGLIYVAKLNKKGEFELL